MPDVFYSALFAVGFPVYKALHTERAYGRTVRHLENARNYTSKINTNGTSASLSVLKARDVFKGIFWNALDSYRGLARFKSVERCIVFENEEIIREAAKLGPVAVISIHQGAFELLHRGLCRYSEHVHLITDSVGDEAFRDVLKGLRSDPHLTEYHPEETGRLIRDLFKTRGILAMVVDQGRHTKGNEVELFGQPSTLYLRLPQKVNRMGASIVTFRTWTEYAGHSTSARQKRIVIRFEKYYPPHYESAGHSLTAEIAREIETWIKENPSQWSWNYHGNFNQARI